MLLGGLGLFGYRGQPAVGGLQRRASRGQAGEEARPAQARQRAPVRSASASRCSVWCPSSRARCASVTASSRLHDRRGPRRGRSTCRRTACPTRSRSRWCATSDGEFTLNFTKEMTGEVTLRRPDPQPAGAGVLRVAPAGAGSYYSFPLPRGVRWQGQLRRRHLPHQHGQPRRGRSQGGGETDWPFWPTSAARSR